jgi:hypothetical protein
MVVPAKFWRSVVLALVVVSLFVLTAAAASPTHFHAIDGADCFVCQFSSQALSTPEHLPCVEWSPIPGDFVPSESVQAPLSLSTAAAYGRAPPAG